MIVKVYDIVCFTHVQYTILTHLQHTNNTLTAVNHIQRFFIIICDSITFLKAIQAHTYTYIHTLTCKHTHTHKKLHTPQWGIKAKTIEHVFTSALYWQSQIYVHNLVLCRNSICNVSRMLFLSSSFVLLDEDSLMTALEI